MKNKIVLMDIAEAIRVGEAIIRKHDNAERYPLDARGWDHHERNAVLMLLDVAKYRAGGAYERKCATPCCPNEAWLCEEHADERARNTADIWKAEYRDTPPNLPSRKEVREYLDGLRVYPDTPPLPVIKSPPHIPHHDATTPCRLCEQWIPVERMSDPCPARKKKERGTC